MMIHDNGVGIFEKIKNDFNLEDRRHAILELSKGKLTSDSSRHSGEGIFFTSRMFSSFIISSLDYAFVKLDTTTREYLLEIEQPEKETPGTRVILRLSTNVSYTPKEIFDRYSDDDQRFSKTVVPLKLAKYEGEQLVSRSQARRILSRLERFSEVVLDFEGISEIGQGFADEMFRVYPSEHPEVHLFPTKAGQAVQDMIRHVNANATEGAQMELPIS